MLECKLPLPKNSFWKQYGDLWPVLESPDTYIVLPAMAMFGACLGRRLWFDQDFVKIYPMMNLLLIGESGLGKSTCLGLGQRLVDALPPERRPMITGPNTKEGIHAVLMSNPQAILTASELANFFNKAKYMETMVPYITELLDYAPYIECNTKGGGTSRVMDPSVTIVGGSTLDWLHNELPDTATGGGFLPRFFVVVEEHKRQRVALPGLVLSPKEKEELFGMRERAKITFSQMVAQAPAGPFPMRDYGVAERFTLWYENQTPAVGHLQPFVSRSRETVLRLGILVALGSGHTSIQDEDMESAIELYKLASEKLARVAVPASADGKLLAEVLRALGWQSKTDKEIYQALIMTAPPQKIDVMISGHLQAGTIRRREDGKLQRIK